MSKRAEVAAVSLEATQPSLSVTSETLMWRPNVGPEKQEAADESRRRLLRR
jgi:hypothetical protein